MKLEEILKMALRFQVTGKPPCTNCGYNGPGFSKPANHNKNCLFKRMEEMHVSGRNRLDKSKSRCNKAGHVELA